MAKKKNKKDVSLLTAIAIAIFILFEVFVSPNINQTSPDTSPAPDTNNSNIASNISGQLNIHYIDVGQADSILLTLNDKAMLIDAGNNADGDLVVNYLKNQGISNLQYAIGTHAHEDHIGGMDNVINEFSIDTYLMPKVQNDTKTFEDVLDALISKNVSVTSPEIGDTYEFSDAKFTILSCKNEETNELNTSSIVIRLVFGEQSYIFCGDAEKENEYAMMDSGLTLKSNVIKIGHHGSTSSSLEKFILAVNPEIAVISVGEGNDYGHPHEKIVNRLNRLGITTYRTDWHGTIIITSDGKTNEVITEKEG